MGIDDTRLRDLLEQSQDLHSDAMTTSQYALDELVETRHDARRAGGDDLLVASPTDDASLDEVHRRSTLLGGLPKGGVLAAAGLGTAMAALLASPAFADKAMDVQMLQTAASIENLAVATYDTALTLDFIGGGSANAVVKAFVEKTKEQHQQHAEAFNAAATRLGGKAQDQPDPVLLGVVNNAKPTLTGPAEVVALAIELEDGAAQTYVANTGAYANKNARSVSASIMGVEAQHVAILLAVQALVGGGAADLIALPPDATKLPAAAGSVGFPDAFYPTTDARPANEGAVQ
jgi:ferritin-like protein